MLPSDRMSLYGMAFLEVVHNALRAPFDPLPAASADHNPQFHVDNQTPAPEQGKDLLRKASGLLFTGLIWPRVRFLNKVKQQVEITNPHPAPSGRLVRLALCEETHTKHDRPALLGHLLLCRFKQSKRPTGRNVPHLWFLPRHQPPRQTGR